MRFLVSDFVVGSVLSSDIFDDAFSAIRLQQFVTSLSFFAVSDFVLAMDVVVFQVMHGVIVVVFWVRLMGKSFFILNESICNSLTL